MREGDRRPEVGGRRWRDASGREPAGAARGFTLLELLIVTVMLGVLAALAVPVYHSLQADAVREGLRQQLRTVAQAQEMHHLEHDVYTADVNDLAYRPAEDSELELRVGGGGGGGTAADGWTGRLTDPGFGVRCAVYYGDSSPFAPAEVEGEIACDGGD